MLLVCDGDADGSGRLSILCRRFEQGQRDAEGGHMRIGEWRYRVWVSRKLGFISSIGAFPLQLVAE